ncbi:2,3-diaminopropionate biosynthesis protein SbnA [Paenibacillus sp. 598K]|uniref:2,3-diaminopropionate biosynthesis protein SbnA n=1 Tax=Paenibacillus sp. 598K TaxID=1117987 RepID=UPI000FFA4B86|nr:2,3-diaminopropionate biosynthesis protein SbnA [Paenibacillus sp. 598K]GBF74621.1 2,3-diaminopropionate biosynthesis protein SbnA [Paenibacillus sp. 598K]
MLTGQSLRWQEWTLNKLEALSDSVGQTPLIQLHHTHINLFCKLEFLNLTGSIKVRPALYVLSEAIKRGDITEHTIVVESSSGNFAIALATICKMVAIRFIAVIDPNISSMTEKLLKHMAYEVVKVSQRDETGGYLLNRLERVRQLQSRISDCYWTNQYGNFDCFRAYYVGLGPELADRFDSLDYAFVGVGSGGTVTGLSKLLRERYPAIKIIGIDTVGSVIFDQPPRKRYIPGIGSSIKPGLLAEASIDEVIHVSEPDAAITCREIFERHGLFVGGSTGSVYYAIQQYFAVSDRSIRPTVVFLGTDGGTPYLDTIYNPEWVDWLHSQEADFESSIPCHRGAAP